MKYFDYPDAAELNPIIYEMASNDIKLSEPVTHLQARTTPNIKSIRVDGGGILTNLNIHQRDIEEVIKFFKAFVSSTEGFLNFFLGSTSSIK